MSGKSVSQQLSELRTYTAKLEIENKGLKLMVADMANTVADHASKTTKRSSPSFSKLAIAYCKANKCNSVPPEVVRQWREESRAADAGYAPF